MLKKYKTSLLGIECKKSQAKEFFMELKKKYILLLDLSDNIETNASVGSEL